MAISIYPDDGAVLQVGKVHDVVAKVLVTEGESVPSRVVWAVEGQGVKLDPVESEVAPYGDGFYATTRIQCSEVAKIKLSARAAGTQGGDATVQYSAAVLSMANRQALAEVYAGITPFSAPPDPSEDTRALRIYIRVVDGEGQGVAGHPVYLAFDPPVVSLYGGQSPYPPVSLPLDPLGKGYIAETDKGGAVELRVLSNQPTIGRLTYTAAGTAQRQEYAFLDLDITMPRYPAPEGVLDPVLIPAGQTSFTVYVGRSVTGDGLRGVFWLYGKGGVHTFGQIMSLEEMQTVGDSFAYSALDNSGKRLNRLAYMVQRGANGYESFPFDFAAVGEPYVGPDPNLPRTLAAPMLAPELKRLINLDALDRGLVLTIPKFSVEDPGGFSVQVYLYLNAWSPDTGGAKGMRIVLDKLILQSVPVNDISVPIPSERVRDYSYEPAPGNGVGTFMADYSVLSLTTGAVWYSHVLGWKPDPPVLLETTLKRRL
ncbi:MAG: hypothetical protein ACN6O8_06095 [Achromobacter sp.]|uniref:hypothetical protein n=1 Tax=Achromobacter sp. TaxID=134375 RepID=UPI003CFC0387